MACVAPLTDVELTSPRYMSLRLSMFDGTVCVLEDVSSPMRPCCLCVSCAVLPQQRVYHSTVPHTTTGMARSWAPGLVTRFSWDCECHVLLIVLGWAGVALGLYVIVARHTCKLEGCRMTLTL